MSETGWKSIKDFCDKGDLGAAIRALAKVLEDGGRSHRGQAWERYCLPSWNLLWRRASVSCKEGSAEDREQCKREMEALKAVLEDQDVAKQIGCGAIQRVLAQIASIQAATDRLLEPDGTTHERYVEAAVETLGQSGKPFNSDEVAQQTVKLAIDRLTGKVTEDMPQARTWLLLVGDKERYDTATRFVMQLIPGATGSLGPDLFGYSLITVTDVIQGIVDHAWKQAEDRCPAGKRVAWWLESTKPLDRVDGDSVGASIHSVVRSLLEGTPLDAEVAISATVAENGELGKVSGGVRKWYLAGGHHCDTFLVAQETAEEAEAGVPEEERKELPELIVVHTLDEAWEYATAEATIFGQYALEVREQWLSQWSKIIDGDKVTILDEEACRAEEAAQAAAREGGDGEA